MIVHSNPNTVRMIGSRVNIVTFDSLNEVEHVVNLLDTKLDIHMHVDDSNNLWVGVQDYERVIEALNKTP